MQVSGAEREVDPRASVASMDVRQGLARPPIWAIPLSKVRVIAKDTLDYTFQRYTFITLHRCIFEVYLRSLRGP